MTAEKVPKRKPKPRKTTMRPEHLAAARKLGRRGYCISDAAKAMGVPIGTVQYWERHKPEFRKAIARVRENSEKWKARRFEQLLLKSEEQLLRALAHVRAKRKAELAKLRARHGERILLDDHSIDKGKRARTRARAKALEFVK